MAADRDNQRVDQYQRVTDQIIAALERGTAPWRRPWDSGAVSPGGPVNATTGKNYRGINVLLLGCHPRTWESGDPRWCSYKQAAEKGWQVRKGEKAATIFFFTKIEAGGGRSSAEKVVNDLADEAGKLIPVLRSYPVFHASQMDGIPAYVPPTVEDAPWRRPEAVEKILRNSGVSMRVGGNRAYYSPGTDHIQLPPDSAFSSRESWSATLLHEMGHATSHPSRLNRDGLLGSRHGSFSYAQEELRAELASVFMGGELGVAADLENHASYIDSWLEVLRKDKREIFRAAGDAQRIADYCLALHPAYRDRVTIEVEARPTTPPSPPPPRAAPVERRRAGDGLRPVAEAMPEHLRRRLGMPTPDVPATPIPDAAPTPSPVPAP